MKKFWKVIGVVLVALMIIGVTTASATVSHCPDGWAIKWEVQEDGSVNGERAGWATGWFSIATNGEGYKRVITNLGSGDYTITGFCAKASTGNTGILPLSALPYEAGKYDNSYIAVYVRGSEPTPTPTPTATPTPTEPVCSAELDAEMCFVTGGEYDSEKEYCECDKPTPTPTPTPRCTVRYYELEGVNWSYNCYLTRNPLTDRQYKLPERFVRNGGLTDYAQDECNKVFRCGEGWGEGEFIWNGEVNFLCNLPCLDCE